MRSISAATRILSSCTPISLPPAVKRGVSSPIHPLQRLCYTQQESAACGRSNHSTTREDSLTSTAVPSGAKRKKDARRVTSHPLRSPTKPSPASVLHLSNPSSTHSKRNSDLTLSSPLSLPDLLKLTGLKNNYNLISALSRTIWKLITGN